MQERKIPGGDSEIEVIEKRSRFIGQVFLIADEAEAREKLAGVRSRFHDARHHCFCYILPDGTMRYSDDGEPQGTAGKPMLEVFLREEVTQVLCVVTRYFGGILLGAGGLHRAYTKSAKEALDAAGIRDLCPYVTFGLSCPYPLFEQMKLAVTSVGGELLEAEYGAAVELLLRFPKGAEELFAPLLQELGAGALSMVFLEESLG